MHVCPWGGGGGGVYISRSICNSNHALNNPLLITVILTSDMCVFPFNSMYNNNNGNL